MKKISKNEKGSTMVEYALIVVFMSILCIGSIVHAKNAIGWLICWEFTNNFEGAVMPGWDHRSIFPCLMHYGN